MDYMRWDLFVIIILTCQRLFQQSRIREQLYINFNFADWKQMLEPIKAKETLFQKRG